MTKLEVSGSKDSSQETKAHETSWQKSVRQARYLYGAIPTLEEKPADEKPVIDEMEKAWRHVDACMGKDHRIAEWERHQNVQDASS